MLIIAYIILAIIIIWIAASIAAEFCFDDDDEDMDFYNSQK